jgi:hypothetical protein
MGYLRYTKSSSGGGTTGGFNNGKIQAQAGPFYFPGDYPYINFMKKAQDWVQASGPDNVSVNPSHLDDNGYPINMAGGVFKTTIPAKPTQASIGNPHWVLRWLGNATMYINSTTPVSGSLTGSGGAGYYEFSTTSDEGFSLGVNSLNGSFISNIELYRKDQEGLRDAGKKFNPRMVELYQKAGVVRFLDWQLGNISTVAKWAHRKPVSYFSYNASQIYPRKFCSAISYVQNSGTDYAVTGNGLDIPATGGPTDRMVMHIKVPVDHSTPRGAVTYTDGTSDLGWTAHPLVVGDPVQLSYVFATGMYADGETFTPVPMWVVATTANTFRISKTPGGTARVFASHPGAGPYITRPPTISLNGTAKVPISLWSGDGINPDASDQHFSTANYITVTYDGHMKSWLLAQFNAGGIVNGVPFEDMIDLCIEVGAHPHFVSPYLAFDPAPDWHTGAATYCLANCPAWMKPRFEGPNETFNTYGGFYSAGHQINMARIVYNDSFNTAQIYGRTIRIMAQQIAAVYGAGNLGVKYDILIGVQSATAVDGDEVGPFYRNDNSGGPKNSDGRTMNDKTDGFKCVNIADTAHPSVTMLGGSVHGKSIGDPVSFHAITNALPINMVAHQKYWVANNSNFSTTAFDITTVSGGGASGQAGITPGSFGSGPYNMYACTQPMPCTMASTIVFTNYVNPVTQNAIKEATDAVNYLTNDNPTQQAARLDTYVRNCTVTSALVVGSISGTTLHVTSITQGDLARRDSSIVGTGVLFDTYITAKIATAGGDVATFTVNQSQTVAAGTVMRFAPLQNYFKSWKRWGNNLPTPILKFAGYEGGWSPDYAAPGYITGNMSSVVTAATKGNPSTVLTLTNSRLWSDTELVGVNPAVVGGYVWFAEFPGEWAAYNGAICLITAVAGGSVTVTLNSSARTANFNGTTAGNGRAYFFAIKDTTTGSISGLNLTLAPGRPMPAQFDHIGFGTVSAQVQFVLGPNTFQLYGPALGDVTGQAMNVYYDCINVINTFRKASKDVPVLKDVTLQNYQDLVAMPGGEFPSVFFLAGPGLWGVWEPDYYRIDTPYQWQAVEAF